MIDAKDREAPQILPLGVAEHHLLQVLLPGFALEWVHDGSLPGVRLTVEFDDETEAIWRRQARRVVRDRMGDRATFTARAQAIDEKLDRFFADEKHPLLTISDAPFVFRYGNGGTLPILRIEDVEYYCLPFRDIDPIGWNIANGASDSRLELLNPLETVSRELREEILIVNPNKDGGERYSLQWEDDNAADRPEFMLARTFWKDKLGQDIGKYRETVAAVTWIKGPDSVLVRTPGMVSHETHGVFLNVSAADFGIEVDRVARIRVDPGVLVLDGETHGGELVDRPMGLFEVNRFAAGFLRGDIEFIPDVLFTSGRRVEGPESKIRQALLDACAPSKRPLRKEDGKEDQEWVDCEVKFGLCPVTKQLVSRHLAQEARLEGRSIPAVGEAELNAFISVCGEDPDLEIAQAIYNHLAPQRKVFFYKEDVRTSTVWRSIEDALVAADFLILICTSRDRLARLDEEWQSFFTYVRYGRKKKGAIIPIVHGIRPHELPPGLCNVPAVEWVSKDPAAAIQRLTARMR